MSVVLKTEVKEKIKQEFLSSIESAAITKKNLAAKYQVSIKTVRKIVNTITNVSNKPVKDKKTSKTIIVTSWDVHTSLDVKFIDILFQLTKYYNAELHIQSLNKNLNETWFSAAFRKRCKSLLKKHEDLIKNKMFEFEDTEIINDNLQFKHINTSPTATTVTSGLEGVFNKSTILCGLTKEIKTEKSLHLCNQLMSTGSIGRLDATLDDYDDLDAYEFEQLERQFNKIKDDSKAFQIAKEFVEPSALIIEIADKKTFFPRHITMRKSGVVYDHNLKFIAYSDKPVRIRPEAIVLGDTHAWDLDEANHSAVKEIAKELKPKAAVLNDFCDFISINHHLWIDYKNVFTTPTLVQEQEKTKTVLAEITKLFDKIFYLESNHDQFLVKFLANEQQWKVGNNYKDALELRAWQLKTNKHPVIKYLDLDKYKNLQFVSVNHDLFIAGNSVIHGDLGLNGARTGFMPLAKVYNNLVCGHFHSPQTYRNAICVGTSSKLKLGYNKGPSNWLHSHCLIFADGTKQLINVINGKWKT